MKIHIRSSHHAGSILIASLVICAIIGITLSSYLVMVSTQAISVNRSQSWNQAIAITEAGIEEALAQINRNAPFFDPADATNGLTANNWTQTGNVFRAPRRYLGPHYYDVTITVQGMTPYINCTGMVWMASSYGKNETSPSILIPAALFATVGYNPAFGSQQSRGVLVNTKLDPMFAVAMAAISTIDLKGNNVSTDSFDSGDPLHNINGMYPMGYPSMVKSNGDVCTDLAIVNSIDVGNANIKGKAKTGPGGTVAVGKNGYVSGGISDDFNVVFPPVKLPSTTWFLADTGNFTYEGASFKHRITANGDYYLNGLNGGIYIATNVSARLLLIGNTKITGNSDEIRISPGATLIMYVHAASFSMAGKGVVNYPGNAANFYYYGTQLNTEVKFNGNASFTGGIYAPNAAFSLGGGGNDTYDFVGASVTRTVDMNGHYNFHYDENLRRIGPGKGFVPTRWTEL